MNLHPAAGGAVLVLETLSEREAAVVSMRYGLTDGQPKTLDEIGNVYGGLTRERIAHILSWTISKLRDPRVHGSFAATWVSQS